MNINLSKRIGGIVGIIIIIVSLGIGSLAITYSRNAFIKSEKESMMELADEGGKRVSNIFKMRLQVLYEVSKRESMGDMKWMTQRQSLALQVDRLGFEDMAVVLPDGTARYIKTGDTLQLGDRDYVKKALEGEANVSDVIISRVTNTPVIMYASPIEAFGEVVGVLTGRTPLTDLNDITDQMGIIAGSGTDESAFS